MLKTFVQFQFKSVTNIYVAWYKFHAMKIILISYSAIINKNKAWSKVFHNKDPLFHISEDPW